MLQIESDKADRLARQLAALTGETVTDAVTRSIEERLTRRQGGLTRPKPETELRNIADNRSADENRSFFEDLSIDELAAAQSVGPFDANKVLSGFPLDEDIDEFLQTVYEARR